MTVILRHPPFQPNVSRYRLTVEQILSACESGYELGYREFVASGRKNPYFHDERMVSIVSAMRKAYPDCAITLSLGERSPKSYQALYEAGANRYLLRETATEEYYQKLHPEVMSLAHRKQCLWDLKKAGFHVGLPIYGRRPRTDSCPPGRVSCLSKS